MLYPNTPWDCHICRSVGVVLGVNVGIYDIHGVSGNAIDTPLRCRSMTTCD